MAYIKSVDDKFYINHKFVNYFHIETRQVTFKPYTVYAIMDNGVQVMLGHYESMEAAGQEIERIIKEAYIKKEMFVEVQ